MEHLNIKFNLMLVTLHTDIVMMDTTECIMRRLTLAEMLREKSEELTLELNLLYV